jgi:hypothetical protein
MNVKRPLHFFASQALLLSRALSDRVIAVYRHPHPRLGQQHGARRCGCAEGSPGADDLPINVRTNPSTLTTIRRKDADFIRCITHLSGGESGVD